MVEKTEPKNGKIVLLVDDDPLIIRMYQNRFELEGYKVNTAFNGDEAVASVIKEKPDVILLDLMMPKMNGVETLKIFKKDSKTSSIPIIILTNLGDKDGDIEAAKKMGALDYIVKSQINLKFLTERVKKAIEEKK